MTSFELTVTVPTVPHSNSETLTVRSPNDKMKSQKDNNNDIKSIVKLGKSKLESRSGLLGGNIIMEDVEGQDPISLTVLINLNFGVQGQDLTLK